MPRKSKGVPLADLCTANVTSAAFVRTQVAAKRIARALITHYFTIFSSAAYPPNVRGGMPRLAKNGLLGEYETDIPVIGGLYVAVFDR